MTTAIFSIFSAHCFVISIFVIHFDCFELSNLFTTREECVSDKSAPKRKSRQIARTENCSAISSVDSSPSLVYESIELSDDIDIDDNFLIKFAQV